MSLFTQAPIPNLSRLDRITDQLKSSPLNILNLMVTQWNSAYDTLWSGCVGPEGITPAKKLAALGTNAVELFDSSAALTAFIITQCAGKRLDIIAAMEAKIAAIPKFSRHANGSITLD